MPAYKVTWTVDVTASSPLMAALVAEYVQARHHADISGGVFKVEREGNGESEEIDLSKLGLHGMRRHVMALKELKIFNPEEFARTSQQVAQ